MKTFNLLFASMALLLISLSSPAKAEIPRLFVTITGSDIQDQAMPLVLANQALDQGADVRVLLCGAGAQLALIDHQAERFAPRNITPVDLLERLIANGSKVEVCAIFFPNSGHAVEDLREGIAVASPPEVAAWMMAPNTRLFSH